MLPSGVFDHLCHWFNFAQLSLTLLTPRIPKECKLQCYLLLCGDLALLHSVDYLRWYTCIEIGFFFFAFRFSPELRIYSGIHFTPFNTLGG